MSKTGNFLIEALGYTNVGLKRQRNEDFYTIIENKELFILADGMGGHTSGQVASRMAIESIVEYITVIAKKPGFKFSPYTPDFFSHEEKLAYESLKYANHQIFEFSMANPSFRGMGTTLIVVIGSPNQIIIGYIGDSRVYRMRGRRIKQVTEDHSLLVHLLKTGQLSPEAAKDFKGKNIILKAVGLKPDVEPDVFSLPKVYNDFFLICSDGLSDLVGDRELESTLKDNGLSLYQKAKLLINQANNAGGKDNITVILISIREQIHQLINEIHDIGFKEKQTQSMDTVDTGKVKIADNTSLTNDPELETTLEEETHYGKRNTAKIKIPQDLIEEEKKLTRK